MAKQEIFLSTKYFTNLNYSLSNEDSFFEYNLLPQNSNHVITICGSGSRVLPLIAKSPKEISIIDSSALQLDLCALRLESVKQFSYNDFLKFWGYKSTTTAERQNLFERLNLSTEKKETLIKIFKEHNWSAPIYFGKWEKAIKKLSNMLRALLGESKIDKLFEFKNYEDYLKFLENDFPKWRFNLFISILANPILMNILLYKGNHAKFKNPSHQNVSSFYIDFFNNILRQDLARNNFFLQLVLRGSVDYSEGFPAEANEECFNEVKKNLSNVTISFHQGDFFNIIASINTPISFISLSDVPSYFSPELEKKHLQLISKKLENEAIVCCRYYLNCLSNIDSSGFTNITKNFLELIKKEKTPFYRFDLWKKNTNSGI